MGGVRRGARERGGEGRGGEEGAGAMAGSPERMILQSWLVCPFGARSFAV
jgi:hypothetical protein